MRSNFLKKIGVCAAAVTGIAVAVAIVPFRAQGDQWDKMTLITVDEPTQVSNTYLEPGTYMFKLAGTDRHIVQIFTKDRQRLINTIIAIPSYRLELTSGSQFTYWETPPGAAKAIRMWYYPGDHDGQEFRYPTQLRQVAAVVTTSAPAPEPPAAQAEEQAPPQEQPPVEIAQNTPPQEIAPQETTPQAEPAPVEIAQNTPPQDNNVAPQPPSQPDNSQPALPQTASPYPLFGLGGLFALGLYAVLRLRTKVVS